jgi:6-pyruvoyltetrahydropterin/6-carboxytetrahydropterin synthase
MFEINAEGGFAAGHALRGYRGKCENQHGHNYKVLVTLGGEKLNEIGLLIDFGDLRAMMNQVFDKLDHQNINDLPDFKETNPSAENLASYIYHEMQTLLCKAGNTQVRLLRVRVWETDRNSATYFE